MENLKAERKAVYENLRRESIKLKELEKEYWEQTELVYKMSQELRRLEVLLTPVEVVTKRTVERRPKITTAQAIDQLSSDQIAALLIQLKAKQQSIK